MPVVLLHPIGLDSGTWFRMDLSAIDDVVPIDMLGHGVRGTYNDQLTLAALADDVVSQADGKIDLVGFSMGGIVALHVAVRHPERVRSLMVMCTASSDPKMLEERAALVEKEGVAAVVESMLERWFSEASYLRADDEGVQYARGRLLADSPQLIAAMWRAAKDHDVRSQLPDVTCPVTIVAATDDWAGRDVKAEEMREALPSARICTINGPHMLQLERPAECSSLLRDHLAWRL